MAADELIPDPGVLHEAPLLEYQGYTGAQRTGGAAVVPWRAEWLEADRSGVRAVEAVASLRAEKFAQCLVHLQKSRSATWLDLGDAWQRLELGGRLLLCGGNELGVVSAVKRLAQQLDQRARVLANRRHARIVLFHKDEGAGPEVPGSTRVPLPMPDGEMRSLEAVPGVFSAKRLDVGTELMLEALAGQPAPKQVLDIGCGIGALGLAALATWPDARATLLDGDARAVACARRNAQTLGVSERCDLVWWDAREPCPGIDFDLILLNPPFHTGKHVDLAPARAMFQRVGEALAPRGRALVVANRTLPWERDLSDLGTLERLRETRGYKLLSLSRRSRSESSRSRQRRGSRSAGSG
ncbi:MAG: methyltransferase [Deltaproteobacteria bacterium]|nr:methyltransferase [Deltaproteobacteria bacterium]MBW2695841.1 methyltransferase [Deltaproteobacteria bacterium]